MSQDKKQKLPQPLLINAMEAAQLLGVPVAILREWTTSGKCPPVRMELGQGGRWSRLELEEWTRRGCPPTAYAFTQAADATTTRDIIEQIRAARVMPMQLPESRVVGPSAVVELDAIVRDMLRDVTAWKDKHAADTAAPAEELAVILHGYADRYAEI